MAWDVDHLVALSADLPRCAIPLEQIRELDASWAGDAEAVTWRSLVAHVELMDQADLAFPIILAADGTVMDGMHRVAKALRLGRRDIVAVRFATDPPPDHIGLRPDELPY